MASVREPGREAADERAESTTGHSVVPTDAGAPASPAAFVTASHEALFVEETGASCDACGRPLAGAGETGEDGAFGFPGEGVYLWARGDEVRLERAPLCASCASAIGVTALARWEIEEEEG